MNFIRKYFLLLLAVVGLLVLICFALLLIPESQLLTILQSSGLVAIISAFLGVVMTVAVTAILLERQSETQKELLKEQSNMEQKKEKDVKVFEKKQEIYHAFLEKFQKIIQDGDITIGLKKEDGTVDYSVDELKDLIFQLAFIQMHTSPENTKKVLMCIADIKETLNDFKETPDEDKRKEQEKFYSDLSAKLFEIVSILKADLYPDTKVGTIPKKEMEDILKKFELYVEVKDSDKNEIQTYFWNKLCEQLSNKGYEIEKKDFKHLVDEFYAQKKGMRELGTSLKIEDGLYLQIKTEGNYFFYGFQREEKNAKNAELEQRIKNNLPLFQPNPYWYGHKTPNKYSFDFFSFTLPDFKYLKNPNKRENVIKDLADEIARYVEIFKNKNN